MAKNGDEVLNQTTQSVAAETKKREGKLKYGIIGTGWIAESHIQSLLKMDDVEIVAGADLVPGRAKAFFAEYGLDNVKCDYKDHTELLDDESLIRRSKHLYIQQNAQALHGLCAEKRRKCSFGKAHVRRA